MSEFPVTSDCPSCDGPISTLAVRCPHCGQEFETSRQRNGINGFVWVGIVSLLWLATSACLLDVALASSVPLFQIFTGGLFAFGLVMTAAGVVFAWFELREFRSGRLNPERRPGTLVGIWVCGITLVLYWVVLGCFINRLF